MTVDELEELFREHDDEFLKHESIPNERRHSYRADLNAFIILDKLMPDCSKDIVSGAGHDEIWLDPDLDELVEAGITEEQVIDLIRCGVRIDEGGLCMFA